MFTECFNHLLKTELTCHSSAFTINSSIFSTSPNGCRSTGVALCKFKLIMYQFEVGTTGHCECGFIMKICWKEFEIMEHYMNEAVFKFEIRLHCSKKVKYHLLNVISILLWVSNEQMIHIYANYLSISSYKKDFNLNADVHFIDRCEEELINILLMEQTLRANTRIQFYSWQEVIALYINNFDRIGFLRHT